MPDPGSDNHSPTSPTHGAAPILRVEQAYIITGSGFLPDHHLTIRVTCTTDDVTDYLAYTSDSSGRLHTALPITHAASPIHITATDHRADPHGMCGLLWSNTQVASRSCRDCRINGVSGLTR